MVTFSAQSQNVLPLKASTLYTNAALPSLLAASPKWVVQLLRYNLEEGHMTSNPTIKSILETALERERKGRDFYQRRPALPRAKRPNTYSIGLSA